MFFGYGAGANGKTTFANVLLEILGTGRIGYAAMAPMTVFTAQKFDQHPTELAMLQGKRLVSPMRLRKVAPGPPRGSRC